MTAEVVLLTGSTGAVGSVVAKTLYDAGFIVVLAGRRAQELQRLASQLGARALPLVGSLDSEEGAAKLVQDTLVQTNRLDALVSTVGGIDPSWPTLHQASEEALHNLLSMNLFGPLRIAKATVAHLKPGARMAFITSRGGLFPQSGPYDLSKVALQGMITILAAELKSKGIRVNAVAPGVILTEANKKAMPEADTRGWVRPEEIANALLYLLSPGSAGITGTTLPMFGS
jgi:NAD(P)-dependent dehydrogenase (short-subunit alcohol dehydrogenase family)